MAILDPVLLLAHVLAGTLALLTFWLPVLVRKGGRVHRQTGRIYVKAMWVVVWTSLLLCIINLVQVELVNAAFLGFLTLLTGKPLWMGVAILSNKRSVKPGYQRTLLALNVANVVAGFGLIAFGLSLPSLGTAILMYVFGFLGVINLGEVVAQLRGAPYAGRHWLHRHIEGMGTSGIAAHTAFLAFGATRLIGDVFQSYWSMLPWLAPTVIGTVLIRLAVRKYVKATSATTV
ncbi:hypothetical protein GCM10008090_14910 [Arenicella chitinivorans]|uniref:DUF2306 domain-containing protein n=1 Tax=Arenicella chitinivorans TaxID=1329800 RepID=A0A918RQF5_9GAMM|nr:hypothetical protein [Arenicella chitinivorans]GHA06259.1 hypothetical protein GCM10008090_14910 [Arenicella chitinivorans]